MWLVHHNCERSRFIETVHVGVFHSKEDAEQFVKDATADVSAYELRFTGRRYKIEEIPVITKVNASVAYTASYIPIGDEEE